MRIQEIITASDGDMVDALAWKHLGLGPEYLPALLDANPGFADHTTLQAGDRLVIPADIATQRSNVAARQKVRLWT